LEAEWGKTARRSTLSASLFPRTEGKRVAQLKEQERGCAGAFGQLVNRLRQGRKVFSRILHFGSLIKEEWFGGGNQGDELLSRTATENPTSREGRSPKNYMGSRWLEIDFVLIVRKKM